jgi:hypothetical protein
MCLRTLLELIQANIVTLSQYSYERKCIAQGAIALCKVLGECQANTGVDRFNLFLFISHFLHLHKLLETFEKVHEPKEKRRMMRYPVSVNYEQAGKELLNMGMDLQDKFVNSMMSIFKSPKNSSKACSHFRREVNSIRERKLAGNFGFAEEIDSTGFGQTAT